MVKARLINIRLNPEKIVDKRILDYLDSTLLSKTTAVKTALIHEIDRLDREGDPYRKPTSLAESEAEKGTSKATHSKQPRKKLENGFQPFSDDI